MTINVTRNNDIVISRHVTDLRCVEVDRVIRRYIDEPRQPAIKSFDFFNGITETFRNGTGDTILSP